MSLVNDVLRNLESAPLTEQMDRADFAGFSSVYKTQHNVIRPYARWALYLAIILITGIYGYKYFQTSVMPSPPSALINPESRVVVEQVIEAPEITPKENTVEVQQQVEPIVGLSSEVEPAFVAETRIETLSVQPAVKEEILAPLENEEVPDIEQAEVVDSYNVIEKVATGEEYYQLALTAYQQKHYQDALSWLEQALSVQSAERFISLKARVLILMNDLKAFKNWQQQNKELNTPEWLQLVAAGYQKLADYQVSNRFYQALAKTDPSAYQWKLAMAINYQRQSKNDLAIALYQNLRKNSQLNSKQRQWVDQQLRYMQSVQQGNN